MTPNKQRLLKVIEAVKAAKPEEFDMNRWKQITACGTVACAAGHYVQRNPRCGLKFSKTESPEVFLIADRHGNAGFLTVAQHFGIDFDTSEYLFDPNSYARPTRANVLRRLRAFVGKLK